MYGQALKDHNPTAVRIQILQILHQLTIKKYSAV
jgi:hypothetical protein